MKPGDFPKTVVTADQVTAHTDGKLYRAEIARHLPFIAATARKIAQDDEDLADELFQVALHALWDHDCTRYTEADDRYMRGRLLSAMHDACRREGRRQLIPMVGRASLLATERAALP